MTKVRYKPSTEHFQGTFYEVVFKLSLQGKPIVTKRPPGYVQRGMERGPDEAAPTLQVGNRTVRRSLITSKGMTGSQKDDAAEGVLDSQDQETSQPAKLYKVNQLVFFIPGKILEWIDLVKVKCIIVQIEIGYIVQRFLQSSC
jgi:hypothetical protein